MKIAAVRQIMTMCYFTTENHYMQSVVFITLTPSIDGECPLGPLCEVLWRSDANRRSLRVYTTIRQKWK